MKRYFLALYAACSLVGASSVEVPPANISLFSEHKGIHERSLLLTNPSSTPINVSVKLHFVDEQEAPATRRLQAEKTDTAVKPGSGGRCANGKRQRILLGLKHSRSKRGGRIRRRLAEDETLGIRFWRHLPRVDVDVVDLDCDSAPDEVLQRVKSQYEEDIDFAELDQWVWPLQRHNLSHDPHWDQLWGMHRIGVEDAWARLEELQLGARQTVVAVIDTGVNASHEDLAAVMWTNRREIPDNGIDDDDNGFVDDIHGYDFYDDDGDPSDEDGHGTHCSGVIAAVADNNIGIAGVAGRHASVQIMALRFLGPDGGATSDGIRSVDYAVMMGVPISSNSWGGAGGSEAMRRALEAAANAGHLFVAAAGNEGGDNDAYPRFPCCYPVRNIMCVGATEESDALTDFSNYGPGSVDIAAPGRGIYSTVSGEYHGYVAWSGTSMACPHVSGAAALIWSVFQHLTPLGVHRLLLSSAEILPALRGFIASGMLYLPTLIEQAEASSWLSLQDPRTSGGGRSQRLRTNVDDFEVAPNTTTSLQLLFGNDQGSVGSYLAEAEVSWPDGQETVNLSYVLAGWPRAELTNEVISWGDVAVDWATTQDVSVINEGNGTLHVMLEPLSPPFTSSYAETPIAVSPGSTLYVSVTCEPTVPGNFTGVGRLQTSSGLSPVVASEASSLALGSTFNLSLNCSAQHPPHLQLSAYSGITMQPNPRGNSTLPVYLDPSIPAEWEPFIRGGRLTAKVAMADRKDPELCDVPVNRGQAKGKFYIVDRGTCFFTVKALAAQVLGARGLIVVDNEDSTSLEMLAHTAELPMPEIPAFLIDKKTGKALKERLLNGESIRVEMSWQPILVYSGHPAGEHKSVGTLQVSNDGVLPMRWDALPGLGPSWREQPFYSFRIDPGANWTRMTPKDTLRYFTEHLVDDGTVHYELPIRFPFYGSLIDTVHISSNGLIIFQKFYGPVNHSSGVIGSPELPNAFLAPLWADLVCTRNTRISAAKMPEGAHGIDEAGVVIQFANMTFSDGGSGMGAHFNHRVSFEVRLLESGRITIAYLSFADFTQLYEYQVGVESMMGYSGMTMTQMLPFQDLQPFSVTLDPWFAALPGAKATLDGGGESTTMDMRMQGETDSWDWLTVFAAVDGLQGSWYSERILRIVHRAFRYGWSAGSWTSCHWANCTLNAAAGAQYRPIQCMGNDGAVYDPDSCDLEEKCEDVTAWVDAVGDTCVRYVSQEWCTPQGGYGSGWLEAWGTFETYQNAGHTGVTACCGCGGGAMTGKPHEEEPCENPQSLHPLCPTSTSTTTTSTMTTTTSTRTSSTTSTATTTTTKNKMPLIIGLTVSISALVVILVVCVGGMLICSYMRRMEGRFTAENSELRKALEAAQARRTSIRTSITGRLSVSRNSVTVGDTGVGDSGGRPSTKGFLSGRLSFLSGKGLPTGEEEPESLESPKEKKNKKETETREERGVARDLSAVKEETSLQKRSSSVDPAADGSMESPTEEEEKQKEKETGKETETEKEEEEEEAEKEKRHSVVSMVFPKQEELDVESENDKEKEKENEDEQTRISRAGRPSGRFSKTAIRNSIAGRVSFLLPASMQMPADASVDPQGKEKEREQTDEVKEKEMAKDEEKRESDKSTPSTESPEEKDKEKEKEKPALPPAEAGRSAKKAMRNTWHGVGEELPGSRFSAFNTKLPDFVTERLNARATEEADNEAAAVQVEDDGEDIN